MRRNMKKIIPIIFIMMLLTLWFPCGIWAEEVISDQNGFELAPLNPDFLQYLEDAKDGTINTMAETDHPNGCIPEPVERYSDPQTEFVITDVNLPAVYDLRSTGRLTPVRYQGSFGSCWTFATYASLESFMKPQTTADFSENNLMWNHGFDWDPMRGGNYELSTAYLARWSGPVSENNDPYGTPQKTGMLPAYHVQDVEYISSNPIDIKQKLMEGGALYTSIYAKTLGISGGTYYNESKAAFYYYGPREGIRDNGEYGILSNHAVTIVGWDDNYDRNNFNTPPPGNGAWIIKNSWGTSANDQGFFYLSYYDTFAGYNVTAFHNAEPTDNYSGIYQHDPLGNVNQTGYSSNNAWGANMFTATFGDDLAAVSTYAETPNATLTIKIYTNVNAGQPTSGTLKASKTVTIAKAGYHTIDLDTPVDLVSGQKFSVVINYNTPGYNYPVPIEIPITDYSSNASANAGESFISANGSSWYDISADNQTNICIKAFTKGASATLQNIAITKSASKLSYKVGESLDISGLEVTGTYSDGTKKVETISADNITGFDSSKAAADQILTVNVKGKTVTYKVQIIAETSNPKVKAFTADKGSGQYTNTEIQLSAEGSEGKAPYQYRFYYKLGSTTTDIQGYSSAVTAIFKPIQAGTYTLYVDVKDDAGKVVTGSIANYAIIKEPFVLENFSTDKPSGQGINTSINLIAAARGGEGSYEYKFYYQLGTTTTLIQDFSQKGMAVFKPKEAGTYSLYVDVKDASGTVLTAGIHNFIIRIEPLSGCNLMINTSSGPNINNCLNLTAEGVSGGVMPYQYKFYYQLGSTTTLIRDFEDSATADFKPTKTGAYTFCVDVKDAAGTMITSSVGSIILSVGVSEDIFAYNEVDGGIATRMYIGKGGDVTVPSEIDGKKVLSIGSGTFFSGGSNLTGVMIPEGVKSIEDNAFVYCGSLTSVIIPQSVTSIGSSAFRLSPKVRIYGVDGSNAEKFATGKGIPFSSSIPTWVRSFSADKASGQIVNTSINLAATGTGGTAPYEYRFYYSLGTETVELKGFSQTATAIFKVTQAGSYNLYVDVRDAEGKVATKCISDYKIKSGINQDDYDYIDINGGISITNYSGIGGDISIPSMINGKKVLEISKNAFFARDDLTSVQIPEGVTSIGTWAFEGCSNLKSVSMPDSVTSIGERAFELCSNLTSINISKGVTGIDNQSFAYCKKLPGIIIPDRVISIGDEAFSSCNALAKVVVPDSVTMISESAFVGSDAVAIYGLSGSYGENYANDHNIPFVDSTNLFLKNFSTDKTSGQKINSIINLSAAAGGGKVPYQYKFYYKLGNTTTVIRNFSITSTAAFTPTQAGTYTFYVDIKDAGGSVVTGSIENYVVKTGTTQDDYEYTDIDGGVRITKYIGNGGEVKIPSTLGGRKVLEIGDAVFVWREDISWVEIPEGITKIGMDAFEGCSGIALISLPVSITSISSGAFDQCVNLEMFFVPEKVTGIEKWTFSNCNSLTDIFIPESVVSIDDEAFLNSPQITIYGKTGSYAEKYAKDKSIPFIGTASVSVNSFTAIPEGAQYINTPVQLTAEGTGGKAPYTYRFSYAINGATTVIKNYTSASNISFTLGNVGDYIFTVDVKDADGAIASRSMDYSVLSLPAVDRFEADLPSGQSTGETIILSATGAGGMEPYQYKFYTKLGNINTVLRDFDQENTVSFTPETDGNYTLCVDIMDGGGKTATKTISNYTIVKAVSVKTFTTDKPSGQGVGTSIKLKAVGSDGMTPYQYRFYSIFNDETNEIESFGDTATFTPTEAGSYILGVMILDNNGRTAEKTMSFDVVATPEVDSFTLSPETEQYLNTAIQLSVKGKSGKPPYQYRFSYTCNGVNTVIKNYSAANTASFTPSKAGTYAFTVDIKDANGNISTKNGTINDYMVVVLPTVTSFTTDKASGQASGTGIGLSASGGGGMGEYQYKFYAKLGNVTIPVQDYSSTASATFTPAKAGTYTLCVDIKDKGGKVISKTINGYNVVNPLAVKTFTAGKPSGQAIGSSINLNASGSDGKPPYQYKFTWTKDGGGENLIRDYGNSGAVTFKPEQAGTYTLKATIKDGAGNTAEKTMDYVILPDPQVDGFTVDTSNGPGVNCGIGLTAKASGGKAPYQYKFYYKQGAATVIQNFGAKDSAIFKPAKAGVYTLYMDVKDANGRIATSEAKTLIIYAGPTVTSLTANPAGGSYVNAGVKLNAAATGGTPDYSYAYYYKLGIGGEVMIRDYQSDSGATFTPAEAGSYTLIVKVKDKNNIVATKSVTGYKVIKNPVVKSFTASKPSGQLANTNIALSATGAEGKAPYQYQFSVNDGTTTTVLKSYSILNIATFKPSKAGTYTLTVDVKDAGGVITTRTIEGYVVK